MDKLVLKVTTDSNGQPLRLDDMPLEAAQAFLKLYEALIHLVELTDNHQNARVSISQSSLAAGVANTNVVNHLIADFNSITASQCDDKEKVAQWRIIQEQIQKNGLGYDVVYYRGNTSQSLYNTIKTSKTFYKKRAARTQYTSSIRFLSGRLTDAGGKSKSNLHIDTPMGEIKISCLQNDAKIAASVLYENLKLSAWVRRDSLGDYQYELCEVYFEPNLFQEFKTFFESLVTMDEIEALTTVHRLVKNYLINKEFEKLRRISRLWIHSTTDIQTLKIVLVLTKAFKDNEEFSSYRAELLKMYNIQYNKELKLLKKTRKALNGGE